MPLNTDWQTWATLAIGLLAIAYLVRRWWPQSAGAASGGHCGTSSTHAKTHAKGLGASNAAGSCGSCQGCGHGHAKADSRASPDTVQPMVWQPERRHPH